MRADRPAVCSDPAVPISLVETAHAVGAHLSLLGQHFHFADHGAHWTWWSGDELLESLPLPSLSGAYQLRNASGVLKAVSCLAERHPVTQDTIREALASTELPGRFQRVVNEGVEWILDVAHNAQAVGSFVDTLKSLPAVPRTHVVLGMLTTKDRHTVMVRLAECVECWYFATLDARHGGTAAELREIHAGLGLRGRVETRSSVSAALEAVAGAVVPGERVLVVGSFITVGEAMGWLDVRLKAFAATRGTDD